MKILVISEVFYPENFLINDLVKEWKKRGYQVDVLTQYPSYPQSYVYDGYVNKGETVELWEDSKIFRFKFVEGYKDSVIKKFVNYFIFVHKGKRVLKKVLNTNKYDHIFVSQTGPLTVALPALFAKKKYGIPTTIWTCDIWPDVVYSYGVPKVLPIKYLLNRFISFVYNSCDNILVSSKRFEDTIREYTNKQILYTPNWIEETLEVDETISLDRTKFNFTFTGNISKYQNLLTTVKGFVKANIPNAIFNIFGDGSAMDELKTYVLQNKIENVKLHGRVAKEKVLNILYQSDILVLPLIADEVISKTEPLKLQSYLYSHKPILGVCNGACKEIIEENGLGICANPSDVDDISNCFVEIIEFKQKNNDNIKESSKKLLENRFNKEITINKINSCLIK